MDLYDVIINRRTIRKFSQKPLTYEMLKKYVNAARLAPSAANKQPLKYKIINEKDMIKKILNLVKWAAYIQPEGNPKQEEEPTAFIAIAADKNIRESGFEADLGAAAENIILSAEIDNVGSCWMGAIDYDEISKILNFDSNLKLLCVIAMGYKAENPKEVLMNNKDVKYFKDENGCLNVPKRSIDDVLL